MSFGVSDLMSDAMSGQSARETGRSGSRSELYGGPCGLIVLSTLTAILIQQALLQEKMGIYITRKVRKYFVTVTFLTRRTLRGCHCQDRSAHVDLST